MITVSQPFIGGILDAIKIKVKYLKIYITTKVLGESRSDRFDLYLNRSGGQA